MMPKFLAKCYFAHQILQREEKHRKLILKPPQLNAKDFQLADIDLDGELYRKPWEYIAVDSKQTSENDLPRIEIDSTIFLKQETPDYDPCSSDTVDKDVHHNLISATIEAPTITDSFAGAPYESCRDHFAELEPLMKPVDTKERYHGLSHLGEVKIDYVSLLTSVPSPSSLSSENIQQEKDLSLEMASPTTDDCQLSCTKVLPLPTIHDSSSTDSKNMHNNLETKSLTLKYPTINLPLENHTKSPLIDINSFTLIEVTEEPIEFFSFYQSVIEKCPPSQHNLLLTPPKIDALLPFASKSDNLPHASPAVTDVKYLESLVWNPFKLEQVSEKIMKTIEILNKQYSPETKKSFQAGGQTVENSPPDSDKTSLIENCIKTNPSLVEVPIKSSKVINSFPSIPKVSLPKRSSGLKDSVENFMKLRQKNNHKHHGPAQPALNIIVSETVTKPVIHDIECEIDEYSMKFINRIFEYCKPDVNTLVSKNILNNQHLFLTIEESYLDFTLKEQIKSNNKIACEILLQLIPMKKAVTIATQIDTEASLEYLKLLEIQDNRFLLCMRDLSAIQFEIIYSGHNTSKMMKLCSILKSYHNEISLILLSNARNSKTALMETITKISGISVAPALSFSDYKCYIYNSEDVNAEFPWDRFSTVIEYNQTSKFIEDIIADANIQHFILNTVIPPQHKLLCMNNDEFKVVAFSSLDFKILQCLETEHNFVVYQRQTSNDYSNETLIIDEKTCVVIIKNLNEIKQVRDVSALFITISLSYSLLNVIFDVSTCHYTDLFSVVLASLAHFSSKDLKIKSFYCLSLDDICKVIVKISHDAKANISAQWKSTELWLKRTWLTEEESNHEQLLSKFPCINAYVAQIMLTTYPLIDLLTLQLQELIENISVVPVNVLKKFHQSVHKSVHLEQNNKTVQFDTVPCVQEYTPNQTVNSPNISYQRTSLPPLETSFDLGEAVSQTYETPKQMARNYKIRNIIKTPVKPKNIVKPFSAKENCNSNEKRAVEEFHKHSFSFSKRRKVSIDRGNVNTGGQTTLFIAK